MKRLCIFSFYQKDGFVGSYIEYLLKSLNQVADKIIFVVNGHLSSKGRKCVQQYTADIILRLNVGYDVGAYKETLYEIDTNEFKQYDEIIFCNNSFYGPLASFKEIFEEMDNGEDLDFWGLCYTDNGFASHIPGMFMVFKKNIVKNRLLQKYFDEYIDENTLDKSYVIATYEIGLFNYLVRVHGLAFGSYSNISSYCIYNDAEICIQERHFPILKRRIAEAEFLSRESILNILRFIAREYKYDVNYILEDLSHEYGLNISYAEIKQKPYHKNTSSPRGVPISNIDYKTIKHFIGTSKFYIMGMGFYAIQVWQIYARGNENFIGFFVSDNHALSTDPFFVGQKRYHFSNIDLTNAKVIVVTSKRNGDDIRKVVGCGDNVLYLDLHKEYT